MYPKEDFLLDDYTTFNLFLTKALYIWCKLMFHDLLNVYINLKNSKTGFKTKWNQHEYRVHF